MSTESTGRQKQTSPVDASTTIIDIEAARFWRDAYASIYPGISSEEFLMEWKAAKRVLGSSLQD